MHVNEKQTENSRHSMNILTLTQPRCLSANAQILGKGVSVLAGQPALPSIIFDASQVHVVRDGICIGPSGNGALPRSCADSAGLLSSRPNPLTAWMSRS